MERPKLTTVIDETIAELERTISILKKAKACASDRPYGTSRYSGAVKRAAMDARLKLIDLTQYDNYDHWKFRKA
jgi:hypothetical protein